jgi:hypothetical protein
MHFRFRGNNIQVVKSQTDETSGKAKSIPVGSINRATLGISDKLRESCTKEELREIETFVKRYQNVDRFKRQHAALTLPEQIAAAAEWLEVSNEAEARQLAEDILASFGQLRKVLNRRGLI